MKILFLTQILPYPPDSGPKVKTWQVIKFLSSRGHQVTILSFVRPEEKPSIPALTAGGFRVVGVDIHRGRLADIAYLGLSLLSGRPFLIERDDKAAMRKAVETLAHQDNFDVVFADQLTMAQFTLTRFNRRIFPEHTRLIFDDHNAVFSIVERMQANASIITRPFLALEKWKVRRYEGRLLNLFDYTLAVSEADLQLLIDAAGSQFSAALKKKTGVIPISVDASELQSVHLNRGSQNILTLGTLHYPPNADGIRWFLQEVFPRIRQQVPEANVSILGKSPPKDFTTLAAQEPDVYHVPGFVPDLMPYLSNAALMVVPVRAGSGMRVRILEAFARGMPVVTTTIGLEGIDARPGVDVLVADTPEDFASETLRLMGDYSLRCELAANARRLAEQKYDWHQALAPLDQIINQLIPSTTGG